MKFHKCLLCSCQIRESEIYCSSCGWEVWAIRSNAENNGESAVKKWQELKKKIDEALQYVHHQKKILWIP